VPALGIQPKGWLKLCIFIGLSAFLAVSGIYTNVFVVCADDYRTGIRLPPRRSCEAGSS
jgi:hypothetical protein